MNAVLLKNLTIYLLLQEKKMLTKLLAIKKKEKKSVISYLKNKLHIDEQFALKTPHDVGTKYFLH